MGIEVSEETKKRIANRVLQELTSTFMQYRSLRIAEIIDGKNGISSETKAVLSAHQEENPEVEFPDYEPKEEDFLPLAQKRMRELAEEYEYLARVGRANERLKRNTDQIVVKMAEIEEKVSATKKFIEGCNV